MKDARIVVWTNPQANLTGTTTNTGPTIDLFQQGAMVGGTSDGTGVFGIGVEIIQTYVSGTQSTDWTWNVSSDASTWKAGGFIQTVALTAAGSKKFKSNLETRYRYAQLVASNTGVGASTSNAYADDMGGLTGTIAPSAG
jgi:hypothetical protein